MPTAHLLCHDAFFSAWNPRQQAGGDPEADGLFRGDGAEGQDVGLWGGNQQDSWGLAYNHQSAGIGLDRVLSLPLGWQSKTQLNLFMLSLNIKFWNPPFLHG